MSKFTVRCLLLLALLLPSCSTVRRGRMDEGYWTERNYYWPWSD